MGSYAYDDQGFRVKKIVEKEITQGDGSAETRTVILSSHNKYFVSERQAANVSGRLWNVPGTDAAVNNIYLNGVRIAAMESNGAALFYLANHVDSVKAVTDDTGAVTNRTEYLPYGETFVQSGDLAMAAKYNGQALDEESDLYFFNARHYDPEVARFVTADSVTDGPATIKGWNRYMYVGGNPIMYKDPTGHVLVIKKGQGATEEDVQNIINDLQKIGGSTVTWEKQQDDSILIKMKNGPVEENRQIGNRLLSGIVNDKDKVVTIIVDRRADKDTSKAKNKDDARNPKKGSDSDITINPTSIDNVLVDKNGKPELEPMPRFITLAHELIHSDRDRRGVSKHRGMQTDIEGAYYGTYEIDPRTGQAWFIGPEELETVGHKNAYQGSKPLQYKPNEITENQIREEHNLNKRILYSAP